MSQSCGFRNSLHSLGLELEYIRREREVVASTEKQTRKVTTMAHEDEQSVEITIDRTLTGTMTGIESIGTETESASGTQKGMLRSQSKYSSDMNNNYTSSRQPITLEPSASVDVETLTSQEQKGDRENSGANANDIYQRITDWTNLNKLEMISGFVGKQFTPDFEFEVPKKDMVFSSEHHVFRLLFFTQYLFQVFLS